MNYADLDLGRNVLLQGIFEDQGNYLVLYLSSGKENQDNKATVCENDALSVLLGNAEEIVPDESNTWKLVFEGYVQYNVLNESYCYIEQPPLNIGGKTIHCYEHSKYIEDVNQALLYDVSSFAFGGKPLCHYQISTLNTIINIATFREPRVEKYYESLEEDL